MQDEVLRQYMKSACKGKKNNRSAKNLKTDLHMSEKELQRKVHRLRCAGIPIAATRSGYFYAETAAEIYATIHQLMKFRDGVEDAIRGLEGALEKFSIQEEGR